MTKNRKVEFKESNLYTLAEREKLIAIADKIYSEKTIRKTILRDWASCNHSLFERCLTYLIDLKCIRIVLKPARHVINITKRTKMYKYVQWISFSKALEIKSLRNLLEFENIDLSMYPIRNLDDMNNVQKLAIKKSIYRFKTSDYKANKNLSSQLVKYLYVDSPIRVSQIRRVVTYQKNHFNATMYSLLKSEKIELSVEKDTNFVVVYKHFNYKFNHDRWKCDNCNHINPKTNKNFCGNCGDKRNKK